MCSVVSLPAGQTIYVLFTVKLLAPQHIHTLVTGSCYVTRVHDDVIFISCALVRDDVLYTVTTAFSLV